jgi:hypothetical protein
MKMECIKMDSYLKSIISHKHTKNTMLHQVQLFYNKVFVVL